MGNSSATPMDVGEEEEGNTMATTTTTMEDDGVMVMHRGDFPDDFHPEDLLREGLNLDASQARQPIYEVIQQQAIEQPQHQPPQRVVVTSDGKLIALSEGTEEVEEDDPQDTPEQRWGTKFPLHYRIAMGVENNVQELEEFEALLEQLDEYGTTPLHVAAYFGRAGVVSWLLNGRVRRSAWVRDVQGKTPSDYARESGNDDIAERIDRFVNEIEAKTTASKMNSNVETESLLQEVNRQAQIIEALRVTEKRLRTELEREVRQRARVLGSSSVSRGGGVGINGEAATGVKEDEARQNNNQMTAEDWKDQILGLKIALDVSATEMSVMEGLVGEMEKALKITPPPGGNISTVQVRMKACLRKLKEVTGGEGETPVVVKS